MRNTIIALTLSLLASTALAQELPKWSAELWATEGGEELVAAATAWEAGEEELAPMLALTCGSDFWLRYDPGNEAHEGTDWTGKIAAVTFAIADKTFTHDLQFEEGDSMFAAELVKGDPLLAAMRSGKEVLVTANGFPDRTFSLAGASGAISDVQQTCQ